MKHDRWPYDRGLSKEYENLETFYELKGLMAMFKAKFLQEMIKRIKNGLLIKDKEIENYKELNYNTSKIAEQLT